MTVPAPPGDDLQARLRLALRVALRARDLTAVAALRSALGAIANAEAVPVPAGRFGAESSGAAPSATCPSAPSPSAPSPSAASAVGAAFAPDVRAADSDHTHFAGSAAGLGAAEAERRRLSPAQVAAIVQAEIDERLAAAAQYHGAGRADRAARLTAEAQALAAAAGAAE
jgi:hypothetical protein